MEAEEKYLLVWKFVAMDMERANVEEKLAQHELELFAQG